MAFVAPIASTSLFTTSSFTPCTTSRFSSAVFCPRSSHRYVSSIPVRAVMEGTRPGTESTSFSSGLSQYEQLSSMTTIVEDTGEIDKIREHAPYAATTNPSLVAVAAEMPEYESLVEEAVRFGKSQGTADSDSRLALVRDKLFTLFGAKILEYVPGDVSTEVDARLSFDAEKQVQVAQRLIGMYEEAGVKRDRVLIKLATTWEGVLACSELERMGIKTNMTLLFSLAQAAAAASAGAYLISPFVGRILDWYKHTTGKDSFPPEEDPGVLSVRTIYDYYKCNGFDTIVMGASFRNIGEILELAGCDRLTIAPKFIKMLKDSKEHVPRKLSEPGAERCTIQKMNLDEKEFRWMMNEDAMATDKLAQGIRGFAKDLSKLDTKLAKLLL